MTKWKTRAIEDEKAIGGLRNPHLSIQKLKGASTASKELTRMLEEHIDANYDDLSKTLDTLGKGEMPEILTNLPLSYGGVLQGCTGQSWRRRANSKGLYSRRSARSLMTPTSRLPDGFGRKVRRWVLPSPSSRAECFPQWKRSKPVTKPTIGLRHGITHLSQSVRREPRSCFERSLSEDG